MSVTWGQSVERARQGNMRAIAGRFQVALASFEQFDAYGAGVDRVAGAGKARPATRTLVDFADDVGLAYATLAAYRSLVLWWCESDPALIDELGVPDNIAWEALRFAKGHWPMATELRALLAERVPMNGKTWSLEELQRLADSAPKPTARPAARRTRAKVAAFDSAVGEIRRVGDRMTRALVAVRREQLDAEQRATVLEHARRAKAAADFLVSYLEGDGSMDDQLAEYLQSAAG